MLNASSLANGSASGGADGDAQRRGGRRTSRPKVKTGCLNCKQRRIKCDEKRPACTRCVRSGRKCTGYPPPPRARIYEEKKIAPKPISRPDLVPAPTTPTIMGSRLYIEPITPHSLVLAAPSQTARALTPPETPDHDSKYTSLTIHQPSIVLFSSHEGQYFQLFRDNTASELSGFFDSSFWTRRVLQECHYEDSIRHAVVALGALYKTLEKMSESPPGSPSGVDHSDNPNRHWEVALKHYSLAIKAIVSSESHDQAKKRMCLMASVLLASFDSFIGDHRAAIQQIQTGLALLETLRAEHRRGNFAQSEEPVEQDLVQMFTRLAIQAKSYDLAFHFPQPYVIRMTPANAGATTPSISPMDGGSPTSMNQPQIPDVFASLHDARLAWDTLCERMMKFTEQMLTYVKLKPMNILPIEFRQYGKGFDEQMEAWTRAFDPILASRMAPAKSTQEKTATAVLKMNQIMGCILFSMTFSASESEFDKHQSYFRNIVDLAMEVVGDEERRAAAKRCPNPEFCGHQSAHPDMFGGEYTARHIKPSFSADLGIVPPLFVVATKCRDALTRHQAIQLLRTSSRREGMWDSELCARIGNWIAMIEEDEGAVDSARPVSRSTEASRLSIGSPGSISAGSPVFGDEMLLGPGGNARWGGRRESSPFSPHGKISTKPIPEERRIMVRAVQFDLQKRVAVIQCGTRGLLPGMPDLRTRATKIEW